MLCIHYSLTTKREYHYKGREPYEQLLHTVYTRFDTPSSLLYTPAIIYAEAKQDLLCCVVQ